MIRPVIRPLQRLAAVGAVVLAASGCGAVPESDVAATVGGDEITVEQLESVVSGAASTEGSGVTEDTVTDTVDGAVVRNVLSVLIGTRANESFLAANGEELTAADREEFLATVPDDDPLRDFPPDVVDLVVDLNAGPTARARIAAPDAAELQAQYERSPSELGVLCVRHVLLESEADAQAVLDELAAGAAIEDVARERSTDPTAAANGGAIELTEGQACSQLADARQALDPVFIEAATSAVPGVPVGPVQTDFGWHVIEARPYDEVADSLSSVFETAAGDLLFASYLQDLDVDVSPRYGRWDPSAGAVVEL